MASMWQPLTDAACVDFAIHKRLSPANPPPTVRVMVADVREAFLLTEKRWPTVQELADGIVRRAVLRMKLGHFPHPTYDFQIKRTDLCIWGWSP